MSNMKEIWKDIPGYENRYQASNQGRIRSLDRYVNHNYGGKRLIKGKILKPIKQNNGYVSVWIEGKTKSIHRLIAFTFLEDKTNRYLLVEHLNHNKEDNRISNLMWSDYQSNNQRSVKDGIWNNQHTI